MKNLALHFLMWAFGIAVLLGLGSGYHEARLWLHAKMDPQTISCADLVEKGFGDNAHIILTDFAPLGRFATERSAEQLPDAQGQKSWRVVYVPIVSKNAVQPEPDGSYKLILMTRELNNKYKLNTLTELDTLHGTIVNDIKSLDPEAQRTLRNLYPNTDPNACLILDHERSPVSPLRWGAYLVVGALSVPAFGCLFAREMKRLAAKLTGTRGPNL
jgi:hypothetical protein